jgi:glycosyltransferase involved in cell wall biosynthesis
MRILFLHPKAWTGEHALLLELVRLGHDICVLEERRGGGTREFTAWHRAPGDGLRTLWYNPSRGALRLVTWLADRVFRRAFEGRNLVHRMLVIAEAVRHFRPDAIVSSDGFSYGIPAGLARRAGLFSTRLLVSYIGGDVLDCPEAEVGHRRTPLTDWLIRASLAGVDVLRPVSPKIEAVLLEDGAAPSRLHVLPSHLVASRSVLAGVAARKPACRAEIRAQYGIADGAPMIVTLSGNHKGKGLHVLAAAWPQVVRALPGARWLLCGPEHPWLQAEVWPVLERAGVRETVIATGALLGLDVFRHLAAADVHVNPSLCESLNMVTAEAAAVGTPTIGSDGAGIAHWISRLGAGQVVPLGEVRPLADAIIFALQNADSFQEPRRLRARADALDALSGEFALERIATGLIALLQGDTDQHHSSSRVQP